MENKKELRNWLDAFGLNHPLVIAGPCSAETEEQLLKIAHQLKDTDTSVLRAGIWKPRTRPGNFEGVGALGLKWLQKAKQETGLLTTTEVANANHVDLALQHDVDILWIGARTTVSPFIVQEIADAVKGTDKIVLVKNPVNPDLALWLGAVERFYTAGITKLGVIHRGFSTYEKTRYRNNPEWQIPIDLQNTFPDLPLILDPSHIAGRRDIIFDLCQTALDLNYDGLMIETHFDPDNAWSDAKQQITPQALEKMTVDLKIRKVEGDEAEFNNQLNTLRTQIDLIDDQIMDMLGKRMKIVDGIGALKKKNNVAILQVKRWNEVLGRMILEGEQNKLSEEFVLKIYKAIHQESINHQKKIING
ncbi:MULTISPECIES: bifunctional 3-deoxy-7-phosphoheptulonate synthase/chorismate mutase type II [Aequorivita]|uniref:chorismate mutase n=1 Tax=Aequorivita iocasae TaxID=2803865 RepID=A0ABX7DRF3_9FLAO|nr:MULTISPECIES: bifunctional 3-deoxy-7-phosphoheptulonate synthase/chorismate mutase type II [Aequorivita]QQX75364.1 bifunctional 3-deoxy-7-phosphoheptulonate synthase/chorismate mutase type II [Aequorivita iocasae]UCA54813.1 bifunctional 3-deoxy-7-phosphoheptulonate synthase/chorismate mutase type II [Aequorivita sp. F7]